MEVVYKVSEDFEHWSWGGCSDPSAVLKNHESYEVESINVRSWHTRVHLKGIEGYFSSSVFEGVPEMVYSERGVWKLIGNEWVNEGLAPTQSRGWPGE